MRRNRSADLGGENIRITSAKPSPSIVIALLALFIALGGGAYALNSQGSSNPIASKASIASKALKKAKKAKLAADAAQATANDALARANSAQAGTVASGTVAFFNLASCPGGWSEVTGARGRYLVGKPLGGALAETVGTALSNLENLPSGDTSTG